MGKLQKHDFADSSFTQGDVGRAVSEFDLTNADASNVTNMSNMCNTATNVNQDLSLWCVEQSSNKPDDFNEDAGFAGESDKQPNWGETCDPRSVTVSATGGSLSPGGQGIIEISSEHVDQLTIKDLWTDWDSVLMSRQKSAPTLSRRAALSHFPGTRLNLPRDWVQC
jgi:hypothetical protein